MSDNDKQPIPFSTPDEMTDPILKAKLLVRKHIAEAMAELFIEDPENVYVVWFAYILGGWKALISTTNPDGLYYEVTFNKDKSEAYVDTYAKIVNRAYKL